MSWSTRALLALLSGAVLGCGEPPSTAAECVAGTEQPRACGACDTGVERYRCSAEGQFELSEPCRGEDGDLPVSPLTAQPVCGRYERPIVFVAPHPDDETIGMAGAIRESLEQGRSVFVDLMTHGEASQARSTLKDGKTDSWHAGRHHYNLGPEEFGEARVRELLDAAGRLGVTGVRLHSFRNGGLTAGDVSASLQYWIDRGKKDPGEVGLSLRGTAGAQDPQDGGGKPHPDHEAVWEALAASGVADVQGYCVYHYISQLGTPDEIHDISPWCPWKRDALEAYQLWDPDRGRFAVGAHSVHKLLDRAGADCREFIVYPPGGQIAAKAGGIL